MTTNPLAVAALVAAYKARFKSDEFVILSEVFDRIFGVDLNTPYPGNILSIPVKAKEAVSFNYCDAATYKKFERASDVSDFFDVDLEDGTKTVKICIYSVREETVARIAMHIVGIDIPFFVRMIPSIERLERFKKHPKICVDSEETLTDAVGAKVPFCTYHTEDSDTKRYAVVPPESFGIEFNVAWVTGTVGEATTSHF